MVSLSKLDKGGTRQLVKDGVWQVPAQDRPFGWETMAVRECVDHTETRTVTTREVVIQHADEPVVVEPVVVEQSVVEQAVSRPSLQVNFKSFLPEDDPLLVKELVDSMVTLYRPGDDVTDAVAEALTEASADAATSLHHYREAKAAVDDHLGQWLSKHRDKLRHVGLSSEPIRDLWVVVHGVLFSQIENANAKLDKEVRRAAHGEGCKCWHCKRDRGEEEEG